MCYYNDRGRRESQRHSHHSEKAKAQSAQPADTKSSDQTVSKAVNFFLFFFKKVLDKAGLLCYYNDRKREKGANPMSFRDYWEANEAEWEAEQEYLRELEG